MTGRMTEPVIVPRAEHSISRRDIDADALKVLYRLQEAGHTAYLVGGSVRDLLLSRRPKDFDIGTSAHPYQIKKLFRNCWIIGRRFRLAHVRFGTKTIEVATFRKNIPPGTEAEPASVPDREETSAADLQVKHDNTFGTSEEDAFRRDFTINALFYDIATRAIIDFVGGLQDLRDGVIRSIGVPEQRFQEDPVRMLRAIVMASRLEFQLDSPVVHAIAGHRSLMAAAAPARLIEEYYKVLRSGAAEATFRALADHRLLEPVTPELQRGAKNPKLWEALAALDAYRRKFEGAPPTLSNPILLGSILIPLGLMPRVRRSHTPSADVHEPDPDVVDAEDHESVTPAKSADASSTTSRRRRADKEPIMKIGLLPIARRDTDRLRQLLALQGRLNDLESSPRAKRGLMHRGSFDEALTWLEIHGRSPAVLEHWRGFIEALGPEAGHVPTSEPVRPDAGEDRAPGPERRRRRRRRRGFNRAPEH